METSVMAWQLMVEHVWPLLVFFTMSHTATRSDDVQPTDTFRLFCWNINGLVSIPRNLTCRTCFLTCWFVLQGPTLPNIKLKYKSLEAFFQSMQLTAVCFQVRT